MAEVIVAEVIIANINGDYVHSFLQRRIQLSICSALCCQDSCSPQPVR